MKKFVKNYIGKAKKVEGLEIIKLNLKIADLVKFAHKYNDEDYISLEVAKLQTPDNFGHDYTVYVNRLEEEQVSEPARSGSEKANQKIQSFKAGSFLQIFPSNTGKIPSERGWSKRSAFFYVRTWLASLFSLIPGQSKKLGKKEIHFRGNF